MPTIIISGPQTLRWEERSTSRDFAGGQTADNSDTYRYVIFDTDEADEAEEALLAISPAESPRGLSRARWDATWVAGHYIHDRGAGDETFLGHWEAVVEYTEVQLQVGSGEPPPAGESNKRFTTQGQSLNAKTGLVLIERRVPDPNNPRLQIQTPATDYVMIGDTGDPKKEPTGADIIVPVHSFAWDFTLPGSDPTPTNPQASETYEAVIRDIVGTINDKPWKGYPTGSVRFDRFQGQITYGVDTTLSFEFSYIPTKAFTIGAQSFDVRGWDFVDLKGVVRTLDADTNRVVTSIDQIDVWQVLPDQNFDLIGIP